MQRFQQKTNVYFPVMSKSKHMTACCAPWSSHRLFFVFQSTNDSCCGTCRPDGWSDCLALLSCYLLQMRITQLKQRLCVCVLVTPKNCFQEHSKIHVRLHVLSFVHLIYVCSHAACETIASDWPLNFTAVFQVITQSPEAPRRRPDGNEGGFLFTVLKGTQQCQNSC